MSIPFIEFPNHAGVWADHIPKTQVPARLIIIPDADAAFTIMMPISIADLGTTFNRALNTWPDPPESIMNIAIHLQIIYSRFSQPLT